MTAVPEWDIVRDQGEKTFDDLQYLVKYRVYDHRIEFDVWQCFIAEDEKGKKTILYQGRFGPEDKIEDAEQFIGGHVKWDGCSNWNFHPIDEGVADDGKTQFRGMHHWCDREGLVGVGELLGRLWDMGKLIPSWSQ